MTVIIVPCFNETTRLDLRSFAKTSSKEVRFLFVDDGSSDGTFDFINSKISNEPHCRAVRLENNVGKGEAIRAAALLLQKMDWFHEASWFGFWDADLATPLYEINHFLHFASFYNSTENNVLNKKVASVWGSRIYRLGSDIKRSSLRHYLGRGFATLVHKTLYVEAYDTQCGAKIFKKELLETAFAEPFLSRWIFDIEILIRLKDSAIIEYPLMQWQDKPGSKLKVSREIFRVLRDVYRIRKKYFSKIHLD